MSMTDTTTTAPLPVPEALVRDCERSCAFAARLRGLADVLEGTTDLPLPYDILISASEEEQDRWAQALTAAGLDVTDTTDDHCRELLCPPLRVVHVFDESMRRYHAERKFLAEHAAEVDAQLAETAVAS